MWKLALSLLFFLPVAALLPDLHTSNPLASREDGRGSPVFRIVSLLPLQAVYALEDFDDDSADGDADGDDGFDSDFDDDDATDDFAGNDDSRDDSEGFSAGRDDGGDDSDRFTAGRDDSGDDSNRFTTGRDDSRDDSDRLPTGRDDSGDDSNRFTAGRDDSEDDTDSRRDDDDDFAFDDADADDGDRDDFERDDDGGIGDEADDGFETAFGFDSDDNDDGNSDEGIEADNPSDAGDDGADDDALARGGEDGDDREQLDGNAAAPESDTFISLESDTFIIPDDNPLRLDNIAQDPDGDPHINGEMLVLVDATEYNEIISKLQYRIIAEQRIKTLGQVLVRLQVPTRDFQTAAELISANAPGASIDYNHTYDLSNAGAALETGADIRHDSRIALDGARVKIGMIDSGVDRFHPSLKQADLVIRDFSPKNTRTSFSHGTAIASLIVGNEESRFTGFIPTATLYAASVFGLSEKGHIRSTTEDLVRAIDWLTANSVPVISMSFAGPKNILLEKIIKTASAQGFTFIAAVGNDGPNAEPRFPSAYTSVIAVTAVDNSRRIYRRAVTGSHVEFSAPGVRVLAAHDKNYAYANFTGSSFAAPYVAALIAARIPAHDPVNKAGVIDFYRKTATDLGKEGRDNIFGFGLIRY